MKILGLLKNKIRIYCMHRTARKIMSFSSTDDARAYLDKKFTFTAGACSFLKDSTRGVLTLYYHKFLNYLVYVHIIKDGKFIPLCVWYPFKSKDESDIEDYLLALKMYMSEYDSETLLSGDVFSRYF